MFNFHVSCKTSRLRNASCVRSLEWGMCEPFGNAEVFSFQCPVHFGCSVLFLLCKLLPFMTSSSVLFFPLEIDSIHKPKQFHWGHFLRWCNRIFLAEMLESYKIELLLIYFNQKFCLQVIKPFRVTQPQF